MKKLFSKKKNELKKANKSQINQIFNRRIKSYLKKDCVSASLISCVKLLNPSFYSRSRNHSRTHFFLFAFFVFFIKNKTTSCNNKMSSSSESDVISKELQYLDLIYYNVNLMTYVFKVISSNIIRKLLPSIVKYCNLLPSGNRA